MRSALQWPLPIFDVSPGLRESMDNNLLLYRPETEDLLALSLWQPYASLIAAEIKIHETRGWDTRHRGRLAIHATASLPRCEREHGQALCDRFGLGDLMMLPFGKIVALVDVEGTIGTETARETIGVNDRDCGDYSDGRFAWKLGNVRPLANPIPAKGFQKLWAVKQGTKKILLGEYR